MPAIRCKECKDIPPVKSNDCIAQEVERLVEESGIWTLLESISCSNPDCVNHGRPIAFHPDEPMPHGYLERDCGRGRRWG